VHLKDHYEARQAGLALHNSHFTLWKFAVYHMGMSVAPHPTVVQHHCVVIRGESAAAIPFAVDELQDPPRQQVHMQSMENLTEGI
jgi:hypothetical protein